MTNAQTVLDRLRPEIVAFFEARERDPAADADRRVPLNAPTFGAAEVLEALDSLLSQNVTMGEKTARFEREFAAHVGARHAIMVNSGSSANLLMLAALVNPACPTAWRLSPGDEVLVPAVTWSTTLWPVVNMGLVPVLVDADLQTLNLSVEAARRAIGPRTKAIFVAHLLGNAADMNGLTALAKAHGLLVLEDSCEALGTTYFGAHTGRFSLAASFSFFFSHHITTIEGGMVVTDDDELAELVRCLRAHGWTRNLKNRAAVEARYPELDPRFLFVNVGYNLRPTELQAAFGLHQLPQLEGFNARRRAHADQMRRGLEAVGEHLQLIEPTVGAHHTWFGFPVLVRDPDPTTRGRFVAHLEGNGVETRPIVAGNLARQPALQSVEHRLGGDLVNADTIMRSGVYWATHPSLTVAQIDHLVRVVRSFFAGGPG
jgi:CDP-4-dehydro-6-deoxyglucose reductase, E1